MLCEKKEGSNGRSLGWENFADPVLGGIQADLFYAGPDGPTRPTMERLIGEVGLRPVSVGGPEQVVVVDAVASLWFALALGQRKGAVSRSRC